MLDVSLLLFDRLDGLAPPVAELAVVALIVILWEVALAIALYLSHLGSRR